jgi:hypothetical protein
MTKNIIQALIVAFLLFIASALYNVITQGGLIRLLGGVTRKELEGMVVVLKGRDGSNRALAMARETQNIYSESTNHNRPYQQWELLIVK